MNVLDQNPVLPGVSNRGRLPNFLIIGAAKSATTSLADYLGQHPEIYIPPNNKEPNYFAFAGETLPSAGPISSNVVNTLWYSHCVTRMEDYRALFVQARQERALGEASVRYLYYPQAPERIAETLPDVRLVAILRAPVSRLYSHYCMNVQYQLEPLALPDAIAAEDTRRAAGWGWDWHYVNVGLYAEQLRRYFALFERHQIKVFLYEEFVEQPLAVFQAICRHIGVDDRFIPDMSYRGKPAYRPRYLALDRWLHWPRSVRPGVERLIPRALPAPLFSWLETWNGGPLPKLAADLRRELQNRFRESVQELEELLGRKTHWNR